MEITNLNGINKVRFNDYSEYDPDKCNNGGCYGFWTDYDRAGLGWRVSYGTTSDFDYCPVCGSFNDHYIWDGEEGYSCGTYEKVSEKELLERIGNFEETDGCYIELY